MKVPVTSEVIIVDNFVLLSYMVNKKPNMSNCGLVLILTLLIAANIWATASIAKYSHWTGIKTEFAAVKAFKDKNPSDGGQSIIM